MWIYRVIGRLNEDYSSPVYDKLFYKFYSALDYLDELLTEAELPKVTEDEAMDDYVVREGNGWQFLLESEWVSMD